MNIVIRTDASFNIGTGHVMRCLTLADALKQQGAEVTFICREHKGSLIKRIEQHGFKVHKLAQGTGIINTKESLKESLKEKATIEREVLYGKQWLGCTQQQDALQCKLILEKIKPDWLIVDHYAIDHIWQALLKDSYQKLMVIDDLADRQYHCDILLDQTYGRKEVDYLGLVPENCQMLLGSTYALLRPEFAKWRDYSLKRRATSELKKLLITMGGVDPDNITGQVLEALKMCDLPKELEIIVVMGETAPNIDVVKAQAKEMPYTTQVKTNVNNMAELMANTDLAIGAAGATTWERCCLGLPSITIMLADNQKEIVHTLEKLKITLVVNKKEIHKRIKTIENLSKETLLTLSEHSEKLLDGYGFNRVIQCMQGQI